MNTEQQQPARAVDSWVRQQIVITARKPEGLDVFDAVRKVAESHLLDDGQLRYFYAKFASDPDSKEQCFVFGGRFQERCFGWNL